jgi:hypothetical protein
MKIGYMRGVETMGKQLNAVVPDEVKKKLAVMSVYMNKPQKIVVAEALAFYYEAFKKELTQS